MKSCRKIFVCNVNIVPHSAKIVLALININIKIAKELSLG